MGSMTARWVRAFLTIMCLAGAAAFAAPAITIASPGAGATVGSPVQVTASATSSSAIRLMQVYVDGAKKYEVKAAQLSTTVSLAGGSHRLTIVAYDAATTAKSSVSFSVSSTIATASATDIPSTAVTTADLDELTGWSSCDVCAGPGGAGSTVAHSVTYAQSSPSRDGNAIQFHIGDTTAVRYGAALWWKYAKASDSYSHFVYDLYFYLKDPASAQALEFDVNQTHAGDKVKYIFGTECDIRGTRTWRVYDNYNKKWTSTGIACAMPAAYAWHHLVWEFERTSTGPKFVAFTLDGVKHYVNKTVARREASGNSALLNVAFQLDGNSVTAPYDAWLDNVKITRW